MAKWLDKYEQGGMVLKKKTKDNYGKKPNVNDAKVSAGPGFEGDGYTAQNWRSPAWGGQFEMGGALPGSVGFMYARTQNPAPANGKYTKKTLASAQFGMLMPYVAQAVVAVKNAIPTIEEVKTKATDVIKKSPTARKLANKVVSAVANSDWGKEKLKNFARNIDPRGYGLDSEIKSPFDRAYSAAILNKKEKAREEFDRDLATPGKAQPSDSVRVDLINKYAGLPEKFGTLKPSAYIPSVGNKNEKYFSSPQIERTLLSEINQVVESNKLKGNFKTKADLENFVANHFSSRQQDPRYPNDPSKSIPVKGKGNNYVTMIEGLGSATVGIGEDERGPYLSYYDNWDLNPYYGSYAEGDNSFESPSDKLGRALVGNEKEDVATKHIGNPTKMYGRIYFDKKTGKPKMQNGGEMAFYQNGLDFKPKSISKKGKKIIKDDMGQWAHPGEITEISSPDITMQGVDYPVLGISDTGDTKMMYPDQDYKFDGKKVTEFPMMQKGGWLDKYTAQTGISMGVESGTYQPTSKVITQDNIKKQKEKERQEAFKAAADREKANRSYISQDRSTPASRAADKQRVIDAYVAEAQKNSPLAQTLGSFTASGYNPEAGATAARFIGEANPIMSGVRISRAVRDPKNNPYGIGEGKGYGSNILGTLGLVGDVLDIGSVVTAPVLKGASNLASNIDRVATSSGTKGLTKSGAKAITDDIKNAFYKEVGEPGSFNIYNKGSKNLQMFDASGKEIATQKILKPAEVQAYNKSLPSNYKTGATPPPSTGLEPYQTWDSEIDWGKWNPEIPKNEKLMDEYTRIEASTKSEGTWMKNPDGSPFAGTPEQFVQSRSENFKKAFPQGADITYRGDNEHYPELRPKADRWYGEPIFTANEALARFYTAKRKQAGYFTPNEPTALENLQQYLNKNYPDMTTQEFMEKYPNLARGAMATEEGGLHQLAIPKTKNALDIDAEGWTWHSLTDPVMNQKIIDAGIEKSIVGSRDDWFSTDDVAQYIKQKDMDRALVRNVDDGILGHVLIHNQKPGNYAKSLRGNNGMFDMNNPNVYAGFPNPLDIADELTPRLDPLKLLGVQGDIMQLSPLNLIPGYGKKLAGNNQTFRKFGNSIQDVIERQALSPKGGSKFRMGRDQIVKEGNWAARGEPNENYSGVFEATFDLNNPAANLSASGSANRNGVLMMDKAGNRLPDIPLTEPGMSFNRRLPFSTRYIPIDKQKLINNQFQFATMAPRLQSLTEKYGLGLGAASLIGKGAVDTYNKYTIDPIIDMAKKLELQKLGLNFKAPEDTSSKKEKGGWLNKYK